MMKVYLKAPFLEPLLLFGAVMYWHFSENNNNLLLAILIAIPIVAHLFNYISFDKIGNELSVSKPSLIELLVFSLLARLQSKVTYIEIKLRDQLIAVLLISSLLSFILIFNLDARIYAPVMLFTPFLILFIYDKLGLVKFLK